MEEKGCCVITCDRRALNRIGTVLMRLFCRDLFTTSENKIVGAGSRSGRINQSQCAFPRSVISLVLPLLLVTPTI